MLGKSCWKICIVQFGWGCRYFEIRNVAKEDQSESSCNSKWLYEKRL